MTKLHAVTDMSRRGARAAVLFGLAGLLSAFPGRATAQDVVLQGRANGVAPPAWVAERLLEDPGAFQFQRGWKGKVQAVRATRGRSGAFAPPSVTSANLVAAGAAVTGTYTIPVIAALYSDLAAPYPQSEYQTRLFGDGAGSVSLSEYYAEISDGVFSMTGTVLDWALMPNTASYYEPVDPDRYGKADEFLRDVLTATDGVTDYSVYDNDGPDGIPNSGDDDGFVDTAAFIYPTEAKSCGGPGIWPHRWTYTAQWGSPFTTDDASANGGFVKVDDYIIQSGLACFGGGIMASGTIAHEMGHALDLPDLYDTDSGDGTDSEGIGHWGLMGSGNHNDQVSPAHMGAWSKDFLGWVNVTTVTVNQTGLQLQAVQTTGDVLKVDVAGTNEYFLLSNRQVVGSDAALHAAGLLVWHIDQDVIDAKSSFNTVNADANHKGVDLEEADGVADMDGNVNRGDDGDPFPGSTANTEFSLTSTPNSKDYTGVATGLALDNITHSAGVITVDIVLDAFVPFVWGDVDDDGDVDTDDVNSIYWFSLGATGADLVLMGRGDIDEDGDVDARDGLLAHSYVDGVSTTGFRVGDVGVIPPPIPSGAPASPRRVPVLVGGTP